VKSTLDTATRSKLRIERMNLGIPNHWPIHRFHAPYGADATKSTTPEIMIKDIANMAGAKCLLCSENIPPANPNVNPARLKIPIRRRVSRGYDVE
jgi:hypothetical protein